MIIVSSLLGMVFVLVSVVGFEVVGVVLLVA